METKLIQSVKHWRH